jgi:arylsulfatase A-like enzyme
MASFHGQDRPLQTQRWGIIAQDPYSTTRLERKACMQRESTTDVGFAAPSTFGGVIPTPALDRIANAGLRYTNFNSTSLCSPTRAALITGRNHHSVGFGVIAEQSTGFPGYNSIIGKESATIGRILLDNGYRTSWFGKDHNTPDFQASQAGPFDQWPTGMGFEYFYGFEGLTGRVSDRN